MQSTIPLTKKQLQVFEWIATGLTSQQVGAKLGISRRTVDCHLYRIYERLHVNNKLEAVLIAMRIGILNLDKEIGMLKGIVRP